MLVHRFCVFEFKFVFEFVCLKWFKKIKTFSFISLFSFLFWSGFGFEPSIRSPFQLPQLRSAAASVSLSPACFVSLSYKETSIYRRLWGR
jgi:hypothetical protein